MNTIKKIVRYAILNNKYISNLLPKVLSILSERPFNMKGQESEELFAYLIKEILEDQYGYNNVYIDVPANKKLADIIIKIPELNDGLELKLSGGSNRSQLSTLRDILPEIRNKFLTKDPSILTTKDKKWLIDKIKTLNFSYTLAFNIKIKSNNEYDITIFDLDSLDISSFLNKKFILKKVAKEKRSEIFIELSDGVFIEICAGRNAFNRGIWIKGVRTPDYIDIVSKTNYIKILLKKSVKLTNFNKNTFMFERAKRTLELIKEYY